MSLLVHSRLVLGTSLGFSLGVIAFLLLFALYFFSRPRQGQQELSEAESEAENRPLLSSESNPSWVQVAELPESANDGFNRRRMKRKNVKGLALNPSAWSERDAFIGGNYADNSEEIYGADDFDPPLSYLSITEGEPANGYTVTVPNGQPRPVCWGCHLEKCPRAQLTRDSTQRGRIGRRLKSLGQTREAFLGPKCLLHRL